MTTKSIVLSTIGAILSIVGLYFVISVNADQATLDKADLVVYKSPTCGCCSAWIEHIEANNYVSEIAHPENLNAIKKEHGIEPRFQSCHTAVHTSGLVFEGHIPAEIITRFIDKPYRDAIGLAVPGMPLGSPGMEYDNKFQPYQVYVLMNDGSSQVYARVDREKIEYLL